MSKNERIKKGIRKNYNLNKTPILMHQLSKKEKYVKKCIIWYVNTTETPAHCCQRMNNTVSLKNSYYLINLNVHIHYNPAILFLGVYQQNQLMGVYHMSSILDEMNSTTSIFEKRKKDYQRTYCELKYK